MDVESSNFKSYQQVPKWWFRLMTASVVGSFVVAVIALGIGIAALKEAEDNDTSPTIYSEAIDTVNPQTLADKNEAIVIDVARPLPGSEDYDGYHPAHANPFTHYMDVVVHGHVAKRYSARLQKGIDDAARLFNVDVSYFDPQGPDSVEDHEAIAEHILNARRSLKSGIAVSFTEHSSDLARVLNEASQDMPVLSLLLDREFYEKNDVKTFVNLGFADEAAGKMAGDRFREAGIRRALCLENDRDSFGEVTACRAFEEALQPEADITRTIDTSDPELVGRTLEAVIEEDKVRAILTLSSAGFSAAHQYLRDNKLLCTAQRNINNSDCVMLATFDETDEILQGIVNGHVAFAMDNQQYLQGYMTILFLRIRANYHFIPGVGRSVLTGPITISNAQEAERRLGRDLMKGKTINDRQAKDIAVRFIIHGKLADPFWTEVKNGARRAYRENKMPIDFRHPDSDASTMDDVIEDMVRMVEEAGEDQVDALVMTLPTNDTRLTEAVQNVYDKRPIPIITINAGHRWFESLPIQAHVGLVEFLDGEAVADRLLDVNVEKALCVVFEKGNRDLEHRCHEIEENGVNVTILDAFDGEDFRVDMPDRTTTIKEAVMATLEDDRDLTAVVSTGLVATEGIHDALSAMDKFCKGNAQPTGRNDSCIEFVAYDVNLEVFAYIQNDELLFAVDQQAPLQGYLPVYFAMIEVLYGNRPFGIVPTGPFLVDASNVALRSQFYGYLTAN